MADVEISYKGNQIATMNASGVKTLLTGDTFCEDDIVVSYTKPSASLQSKTVSPTTSQQTVTADAGYDALSSVVVNAMPAGSASISSFTSYGSPSITIDEENGEIIASNYRTINITPSVRAGYVSSGTSGSITISEYNSIPIDIYDGEHHQPPILTISLTNPSYPDYFDSCEIYDETSGETKIGEITSATGSVSLDLTDRFAWWDTDTLNLGVVFNCISGGGVYFAPSGISCNGDVSFDYKNGYSAFFTVTGTGTIVFNGVNYNF